MNVFGKTIDEIRAKIKHMKFLHNVLFWMIILIILEMNINDVFSLIEHYGCFFSIENDSWSYQSIVTGIRQRTFHMLDYVYLQTLDLLL